MGSQKVTTQSIRQCDFNWLQSVPALELQLLRFQQITMGSQKVTTQSIRRCDFNKLKGLPAS
jgi:hypothetical protein